MQQEIFVDSKVLLVDSLLAYAVAVATVGENFKRIRKAKGIKQEQIYKQLGYKRPANVSLIETSRRLPKPGTIERMAKVLECGTWELMENVSTPYDDIRRRPKTRRRVG